MGGPSGTLVTGEEHQSRSARRALWRRLALPRWRARDDRGRPITVRWLEREACKSEGTSAIRPLQEELLRARGWFVGIVSGLVVATAVSLGLLSSTVVSILVGLVLGWGLWRLAAVALHPRTHRAVGRVVRHGLCGACAYPLGESDAAGGYIVCPECGSSWKRERVKGLAGMPEEARRRAARAEVRGRLRLVGESGHAATDDLGESVKLHFRSARRCAGLEGDYARRVHDLWRSMRWSGLWLRGLSAMVFLGIGVGVGAFMSAMGAGLVWPIAMSVVVWGLFAVCTLVSSAGVNWEAFARHAVGLRVCPSCWDDLKECDLGANGCVVCPECGAAWRLAESADGLG